MPDSTRNYISYLLRLWQTKDGGQLTWHASLQDVITGKTQRFASLDLLIQFISERTSLLDNEKRHPIK